MADGLFDLEGEVSRVIYDNPDNGFAILKLVDPDGVEQTVKGSLSGVVERQYLRVTGDWVEHPDFGRQMLVHEYEIQLPSSPEGLKRFLASGVLPGIGAKRAAAIVDHFGEKTLEILDRYPGRLEEIGKLSKKSIQKIIEAWQGQRDQREIFIYLQGLGISNAYARKLMKRYGAQAPAIVRRNPYRLAEDIEGIGFLKADAIAMQLGVAADSPERLAAGAVYTLNQQTQNGHVCYPETLFLEAAAELLKVDGEAARSGLQVALNRRLAVVENGYLYAATLYRTETAIPEEIARLARAKEFATVRWDAAETMTKIVLNEEQRQAVERVGETPLSLITGGPGVGKTTVIGEIVRRARKRGLKIALAAPTGRAAKRLSEATGLTGKTLHRLLIFDPLSGHFVHDQTNPLESDLVIVDEVSMLDVHLALALLKAVKTGASLVLVGDADQLPSVGPGTVLADFMHSGWFAVTRLTQVYRQGEGSRIITAAHQVNHGIVPEQPRPGEELRDFYWIEQDDPEKVMDIIGRLAGERIPERFGLHPVDEIQVLAPMNRGSCGTISLNRHLQEILNPGEKPSFRVGERTFKLGDKLMQTSNNYEKSVFNGDLGRLLRIDERNRRFAVAFDNAHLVEYTFDEAEQLMAAYAVTVHKSQGCEFPAVIVPMLSQHFMMLQRNLLYTAMTRARKLLILIGPYKAVRMAVENSRQEPRYSQLLSRLRAIG